MMVIFIVLYIIYSADNSYTPIQVAYISDVLPEHQRTMAFSVGYAFCALGLFLGVGMAIGTSLLFGDEANFVVMTVIRVITMIYLYFRLPESLKVQHRKPFTTKNLNPFRYGGHRMFRD